ncbi:MAG: hypothetical protein ACRD12_07840 [Acidimicrobiales bacterium]
MDHGLTTGIQARDTAPPIPGAGGDEIRVRVAADDGACPLAVVEGLSEDHDWAPLHVGEAYAEGPTLERLVEIAHRHGVQPHLPPG